jgi:hypothetical protein
MLSGEASFVDGRVLMHVPETPVGGDIGTVELLSYSGDDEPGDRSLIMVRC